MFKRLAEFVAITAGTVVDGIRVVVVAAADATAEAGTAIKVAEVAAADTTAKAGTTIRVAVVAVADATAEADIAAVAGIRVEPRKLAANNVKHMNFRYHAEPLVVMPQFARETVLCCNEVLLLRH